MTVPDWLAQRASAWPERTALAEGDRELSYGELRDEAARVAGRIAGLGARRGARLGVLLAPGLELALAAHAAMRLGAVLEPLAPDAPGVPGAGAPGLVVDDPGQLRGAAPACAELLDSHGSDDVLCRMRTSGTSAEPKAVELTYANFLWSAAGSACNLGLDPDDRWLCCLPLHHVGGFSILVRSVIYGTAAELQPRFDVASVAEALESGRISLVSLVATQLARLLDAGAELSAPRALLIGGGPLPAELIERAAAAGARVVPSYGMTETCSQAAALLPGQAPSRPGSAGRPLLGARLRIDAAAEGSPGDGAAGEILVAGPIVAPGALAEDGWLHTGDLGRLDADGYLHVLDRLDDTILSGGENVAPAAVERALESHPGVLEAAVVGRRDPEWQQAVTAVVVAADPARPPGAGELRRHCAERLAAHEVPKRFELAAELPRTASGKLLRRRLRDAPPDTLESLPGP